MTFKLAALRRFLGKAGSELALHADRLISRPGVRTVVFLPWSTRAMGSVNLRVYEVASRLRRMGWRAVVVPPHLGLSQRRRLIKAEHPDVIVVQKAGHRLNRAELYKGAGAPVVFDLDDADYLKSPDKIRSMCEGSAAVIAGSAAVARWCRQYNDDVRVIWTGTPLRDAPRKPQTSRDRIVTWAPSRVRDMPEEAAFIGDVLERLAARRADVAFRLYGFDDSPVATRLLERVERLHIPVERLAPMPYQRFLDSLQDVAVGLNPLLDMEGFSGGKSFGKLLAYLDADVAVVTTPNVDHPRFFKTGKTGVLAEGVEAWAAAVDDLLGDPAKREAMTAAAHRDYERRLSSEEATRRVEKVLLDVVDRR